ncbi:Conserved_hypothetical protein [Hexamita inflata]|uniref:Uncharacterized protein n=1 Tax=Hexamita inflata TaxID=28002 RepID=A0AA86P9K4_9EUKA|nr:Conserved hypothetical protein [Hexamita inflata]CAI9934666.1 Conserved hypothetical protein [Hexamita inflata]
MTELFDKLKTMSSPYEQSKLETFRIQMEAIRTSPSKQQQEQEFQQSEKQKTKQGLKHYSPSPTVYAYGKAIACQKQKVAGAKNLLHSTLNMDAPKRPDSNQGRKTLYHEKFTADQDYIYAPKTDQTHVMSMNKSNLGQTAFVPTIDMSTETLYSQNFLQTQVQHDQTGQKANVGLEPLQTAYIVQDGDLAFAKLQSGRLAEIHKASGLLIKSLKRETADKDPKDIYLEAFKRAHAETAPGIRPHCGGTVFTRKIKEEEWTEVPEVVKQLKMDMRTSNRAVYLPASEKALEISAKDRETSRLAFHKDHNGENPVAGGVYHKPITTNQYFDQVLEEEDKIARDKMDRELTSNSIKSAIALYGCKDQEAVTLVEKLSVGEKKQLVFLATEAKRRQEQGWDKI